MKIAISFNGKHKYNHTPVSIKEKLESLVTQRFSDQFSISDVQLTMTKKEKDDSSQNAYFLSFDCKLNRSDLESHKHVLMLDTFITENLDAILDTKKKFTFSQTCIGPNISSPAIEAMTDNRLSVDRFFADICAKDLKYCRTIVQSNVVEVNIEYEQKATGIGYATGKSNMVLTDQGKASFDNENPYHAFAAAILNNKGLRKLLASDGMSNIEMEKNDNKELIFTIKTSVGIVQTSPIKNKAPEISVAPSSLFARQQTTNLSHSDSTDIPTASPF